MIEQYAVHIAPKGGKIDQIVDQFNAERQVARQKRFEYGRSKGADGTYGDERSVIGLSFKEGHDIPDGWAVVARQDEFVAVAPKATDRTKAERERVKAAKAELAALPALPTSWEFTNRIGAAQCIVQTENGGFGLANCWYERIGGTTFVMTPWTTHAKGEASMDDTDAERAKESTEKRAFLPEGCERVGLSVYYAAKEQSEKVAA